MPDDSVAADHRGTGKMECFEAIRGLAALAVVIGHTILAFYPALYACAGSRWENMPLWLRVPALFPGKFLWRGELPVEIFFVLSGFVLALAFFQKESLAALRSAAIRRYPRLMLPIAASVVLCVFAYWSGLAFNQEAARHMDAIQGLTFDPSLGPADSNNWVRGQQTMPDLGETLRTGIWGVSRFNPVLWTMPIELAGSFLVYTFLALFGGARKRWLLYAIGSGFLWASGREYLVEFLGGIALCDLWTINQRTWRRELSLWPALSAVALAIFVVPWTPVQALLIVAAAAASPRLQQCLSAPWLSWLGRVSFALYLIHLPILASLSCGLYLWLCRDLGWTHGHSALTAGTLGLAATLPLAWGFCLLVDRPAIGLARWIDNTLFRPRADPAAVVPKAAPQPLDLPDVAAAA